MPKAAHILKAFYDKDLLEEEVILQWSEKVHWSTILCFCLSFSSNKSSWAQNFVMFCFCQVSKKYVSREVCSQIHEKVAPFIKWLKEAEEEESSEEEEEEEVEVVYDTKAQQLKAHVDNTAAHEEDDDLDIDSI